MYFNKSLLLIISIIYLISFIQTALSQCVCDDPVDPSAETVTVTSSIGVNIRDQPCVAKKVGSLAQGAKFSPTRDCLGQCVEGSKTWLQVNDGFIWAGATDYPFKISC